MKPDENLNEPISTKDAFWLVWCPQGENPKYRHSTREEAEAEAERLAREHDILHFYVLKAVSKVNVEFEVHRTNFE